MEIPVNTGLIQFNERAGAVVGLGPEATAQFVSLLAATSIRITESRGLGRIRIPFTMQSANVPEAQEAEVISGQISGEPLLNLLEVVFASTLGKSFAVLNQAGCTSAHVHCNTLGLVVEAFGIKQNFERMKVLTVADAIGSTFRGLRDEGITAVFPFGTNMTVNGIPELADRGMVGGMYDTSIQKASLDLIKPSSEEQFVITSSILDCVQGATRIDEQVEAFASILRARGIIPFSQTAILICCTDLHRHGQLLAERGFRVVDTAESVVEAAINRVVDSAVPSQVSDK